MSRDLFGNESDEVQRSNLVDLDMQLHDQSPLAILVSLDGTRAKARWLPKSLVEFERKGAGVIVEVTLPKWLAEREGLV